jgi:hypothetical protein
MRPPLQADEGPRRPVRPPLQANTAPERSVRPPHEALLRPQIGVRPPDEARDNIAPREEGGTWIRATRRGWHLDRGPAGTEHSAPGRLWDGQSAWDRGARRASSTWWVVRLREEFHDLDDIRYLLRYLNITGVEEALEVVTRYFDAERLPPKTRLALEELLAG